MQKMDLGVKVDSRLNVNQGYTLLSRKANHMLVSVSKCVVCKANEAIIPLHLAFMRLHVSGFGDLST